MPKRKAKMRSAPAASVALRESQSFARSDVPQTWAAAVLLAFLIGVVYVPALNTPFIYDDYIGIVRNKSINSLWPLAGTKEDPGPLNTPPDNAVSGRPLVNLSLAVNHYLGELNPAGYHAFNVVLHFCTSVLVWLVIRRTLRL